MSLYPALVLAAKEIRDARRNKWFMIISGLFALLSISLSLLGLAGLGTFGVAGFGRTAASLLNLVLLIVPLMGLLLGAMSIAAEKEQGSLGMTLAQPVTRGEVFVGKYLGSAAALGAMILFGFGGSGLVIAKYAGLEQIGDYLTLVGFTILLAIVYLGVGFCVSVVAKRQAAAVGAALFLWFLFIFLSDLGLMGTALALRLSAQQLFWLAILNPAQVFKLAVIGRFQRSFEAFGASGLYALDVFGERLVVFLVSVMVFWVAGLFIAAILFFKKQGLE